MTVYCPACGEDPFFGPSECSSCYEIGCEDCFHAPGICEKCWQAGVR